MSTGTDPGLPTSRRRARIVLGVALALLTLGLALRFALQPQRATGFLLARAGAALGLEITAAGRAEYRLRGTPQLVLREVVVREPGAATPLLRAERIFVSLPWSTLRARGAVLAATRLELDAPVLDLPALRHWLATRPPTEKKLPTLSAGLRIRDGSLRNDAAGGGGWRIDRIQVDLPRLIAERPLQARLRGRYLAPPLAMPLDLALAIARPDALLQARVTGAAIAGRVTVVHGNDWRLPATVTFSGPLVLAGDGLRIAPARLGVAAIYASGATRLPFAFDTHGPLRFERATWTLAPVAVTLRPRGGDAAAAVPTLDARGQLVLGQRLQLRLHGTLADWPRSWPALPPPLAQSRAPLPLALDYAGAPDLSAVVALRLQRDATRFDGRFRLREVGAWAAADAASPLPPLDGTLRTPRLDIAGARLDGVEITFDDPGVPDAGP
ncbi:hypothetical protein [Cognatiluteimonas weifangensis]|uniref:Translocation/assembly module TamB n=1 Tax=Cognatiluteimonas weifangensis TaxID=2303539 RepID=A0A372DRZ9_9GAMM|nr:hypothetical protein [Luteimonas weifangensis]RFP62336.1 hypothetical protein D0Y53_00465 [Luteimonas weifangensis]